jgi:hypothetical protein
MEGEMSSCALKNCAPKELTVGQILINTRLQPGVAKHELGKPFQRSPNVSPPRQTVKTVRRHLLTPNTRLKPGVNEIATAEGL